jgi:hypothetical protein
MKLLDLMSWGLPCESTPLGARGLRFDDGAGCPVPDEPAAFADAVVSLLDDRRRRDVVDRGRKYVLREATNERTGQVLTGGIAREISRRGAKGPGGAR